jgi:hypothetical protein
MIFTPVKRFSGFTDPSDEISSQEAPAAFEAELLFAVGVR